MLLSLAIALNLAIPAPQSEMVVRFHPTTIMAKKWMVSEQSMNLPTYKPSIKLEEGILTLDGKTYKIYMQPNYKWDLNKKRNWDGYIEDTETQHGVYVDADNDGDFSISERWMPDLPIRFGDKMLQVKAIGASELTFIPVSGLPTGTVEGQSIPSFDWKDVDGNPRRLEDYKGKYLLIDIFSVTCYNCMEEWPHVLELQKKFGEDRLKVLLVSCDMTYIGSGVPNADKFPERNKVVAKEKGMPWPNVLVPGGWEELIPKFNAYGYGLYLIDPNGKVLMARDRLPRLTKILEGIK